MIFTSGRLPDTHPPMLDFGLIKDHLSLEPKGCTRNYPEVGGPFLGIKASSHFCVDFLSARRQKRFDADVRAPIYASRIPKDIYKLIPIKTLEAIAIWDNVKMLLADGRVVIQNVQGATVQNQRYCAWANWLQRNGLHRLELGMPMQVMGNVISVIIIVDNQQSKNLALNEDNLLPGSMNVMLLTQMFDDERLLSSIFMSQLVLSRVRQIHYALVSILCINLIEGTFSRNAIDIVFLIRTNICASSALNSVCVSLVNDAIVPHDPIAIELKIYKEQVVIYEQHAKFELTEREQRMDDQMRMLIQNRNNTEENLKRELILSSTT
ncbi:hypothetical protein Tco_0628796 [Tanacetum coccineum]|uniref:Uncharacterized protein n=1 Tax=Tanacetum coccineum TaxID=301880 RepID=A0ABQ4WRA7_9ASTR